MQVFAKIFGQIYDSSIADHPEVRRMFMDLLVLADDQGVIDMTPGAIAARTRIPLEEVSRCIAELEKPDPMSRTPDMEGRRLVLLDPPRPWGWRIVNFTKYRESASKAMIRMAEAERKATYRARFRKPSSSTPPSPERKKGEREQSQTSLGLVPDKSGTEGAQKARSAPKTTLSDEEFLKELEADPTYSGINVRFVDGKMRRWCAERRKKPTRRRLIDWLNSEDKPMQPPNGHSSTHARSGPQGWKATQSR